MEIKVTKAAELKQKPNEDALGFGQYFTDYMFVMDWTKGEGWHDARIVPYGNLSLSPAATVFHYGAEIFEGMKAYRGVDGKVRLFRPEENFKRMNNSAERMSLPQFDGDFMLEALEKLLTMELDWVPHAPNTSLYIRPFEFAVDPQLGVHGYNNCMFVIICSPVGNYYKEGLAPVKIVIETEDVRAVRGGTGYAKCGGNYAASQRAGTRAEEQGYSQVLWLDGVERRYIEEVGSMNVMFKIAGKVVTPKLTGSVLPGITRKSCIELCKNWGVEVEERLLSVDELIAAIEDGTLEESWGTGTAAVVSPIGEIFYKGVHHTVCGGKIGEFTQKLFDTLTGIQWGRLPDENNWTVEIG